MARDTGLNATLVMTITSMSDATDPGGPKSVIDAYMSSQGAGSYVRYFYQENYRPGVDHAFGARMHITVASRSEAATKMTQIDNNLTSLPQVIELTYNYSEKERYLT